MLSYHFIGFLTGLFGSIHCVGMCGPLQFALQGQQPWSMQSFVNKLLYQLGRVSAYTLMGVCIGTLTQFAEIQGWQQAFSLLSGSLLILLSIGYFAGRQSTAFAKWSSRFIGPLVAKVQRFAHVPGVSLLYGMTNGLLPCGMVYLALVSSLNADSFAGTVGYMAAFGLGTVPLMLLLSSSTFLPFKLPKLRFQKLLPILFLIMGCWFILRGANLGIPYLSPFLHLDGAAHCK